MFGEADRDRSGNRQKDQGGLILLGHMSEDCLHREKMVETARLFSM